MNYLLIYLGVGFVFIFIITLYEMYQGKDFTVSTLYWLLFGPVMWPIFIIYAVDMYKDVVLIKGRKK